MSDHMRQVWLDYHLRAIEAAKAELAKSYNPAVDASMISAIETHRREIRRLEREAEQRRETVEA
jgi:hypothetical protein